MRSILHVDRSAFFQKVIKDILLRQGFLVYSVSSAADALKVLNQESVDLVITGLELSDAQGQDLVRDMNASGVGRPVIVITSSESLEMRQELFSLGVADYVLKQDLNEERLLSYINSMIGHDRLLESIRKLRIAVLDDSKLAHQLIKSIFELHGILNVTPFTSPEDLIAHPSPFDIYLVDLVLPRMTGEEVVHILRERDKEAVIIVASGINHTKTVSRVLETGADDFIYKPFDAQLFMAKVKSAVRTFLLVKEVKEKQAAIEALARTDGLTGVLNHRSFVQHMDDVLGSLARGGSVCLAIFDLDGFKSVNDRHGHLKGDDVLRRFAAVLGASFGESGMVGRYGGDEFMVLLRDSSETAAVDAAEACVFSIRADEVLSGLGVTASVGVAAAREAEARSLIARADAALYEAKAAGKNRVALAG